MIMMVEQLVRCIWDGQPVGPNALVVPVSTLVDIRTFSKTHNSALDDTQTKKPFLRGVCQSQAPTSTALSWLP